MAGHPDFLRLETERLTIRFPMPEDAKEAHAAIHESWPELHRWMDWAKDLPTLEECERVARERQVARAGDVIREIPFGLFLKGTATLVGRSDIHNIDWSVPRCEIGYWVRSRFARQGYVTEAVAAITTYAFDVLGARRVEIRCDVRNARSAGVPRRLGFVHEATLKDDRRHPRTGELSDTLVFAKTRAEAGGRDG
ncbi:MAG TPA: GNAT family protein [Planctomycetota bacterium]|nr:GNAT family protein [Planctomycetota bacterium]